MAQVRIPRTVAGMLHETARLLHDPRLLVWALFVFLIPFYVFSSGLPQPGDLLLVPLAILALRMWNGRLDPTSRGPLRALLAFTLWVIVVNWGWAVLEGNYGLFGPDTFLLFPIYYVYNTLVFLIVCVLYRRYGARFLWLTLNAVLITVLIQCVASLVLHRANTFRGAGFFNNPNQLGFFALVAASILALGKRNLGFGTLQTGVGMTACLYLALVSASRAAVIGGGVLIALTVISNPRRIAVVAVVVLGLVAIGGPVMDAFEGTQQRLVENRYPELDFFQERGYDRIAANQQYWVLGAGEGGTARFAATTRIGATEIHSSAGTIFFSYGLVGVALFLLFLYRVAQGAGVRSIVILAPTLIYTIAHQGLRSTPVWILFGMFVCVKHLQRAGPAPAAQPAAVPRRIALA